MTRAIGVAVLLVLMTIAVDGVLQLGRAGRVLPLAEVVVLLVLAAVAVAAVAAAGQPRHLATPTCTLFVFVVVVAAAGQLSADSLLSDAQGGLAMAVVLVGQSSAVGLGLVIERHRNMRPGRTE